MYSEVIIFTPQVKSRCIFIIYDKFKNITKLGGLCGQVIFGA